MIDTGSDFQKVDSNIQFYLAGFSPFTRFFYLSLIFLVLLAIAMLPFCYVNVITRTEGIIRPEQERVVIKSLVSATVAAVYGTDGKQVQKGDTLFVFRNETYTARIVHIQYLIQQCTKMIHDLNLLTRADLMNDSALVTPLETSLYQSQYRYYADQLQEKNLLTRKLQKDLHLYSPLAKDKVIAPNEYADISFQFAQAVSVFQLQMSRQISQWETELSIQKKQLTEYETELKNLQESLQPYVLLAPVSGTILMQDPIYAGTAVMLATELCSISPEQNLIVECWLPPSHIITLYPNQSVTYTLPELRNQMQTTLTGNITDIAKDYTLMNNKPVFRVKCSLAKTNIQLQNGFMYPLKKGLLLETRFYLARKNCWQLLYQQLYDWFNPATLAKSTAS